MSFTIFKLYRWWYQILQNVSYYALYVFMLRFFSALKSPLKTSEPEYSIFFGGGGVVGGGRWYIKGPVTWPSRPLLVQSQYYNNIDTTALCEVSSKLTIKPPEYCQWRRSGIFIVKVEPILHLFLVFLLLTLNKEILDGSNF